MAELERCSGTQFDPVMVDALLAALEDEGWTPEAVGPEPLVAVPSYGRDDDDPTSGATFEAASESPARAEAAAVAEVGSAVEEALGAVPLEAVVEELEAIRSAEAGTDRPRPREVR